jgi:hypothetical protein
MTRLMSGSAKRSSQVLADAPASEFKLARRTRAELLQLVGQVLRTSINP